MQPSVLLRAMAPSDYDGARALWLSCPGLGLNDVDDSPGGFGRFLARNPRTCFVAETGEATGAPGASPDTLARVSAGTPAGASAVSAARSRIVGTIMAGHDGRRGYIYHAAVAPGMQGHGIGTRLVDAALAALAAEGIAKVALVALANNEAGNAFWEHKGFAARHDIVYRDRVLRPMVRLETTGEPVAPAEQALVAGTPLPASATAMPVIGESVLATSVSAVGDSSSDTTLSAAGDPMLSAPASVSVSPSAAASSSTPAGSSSEYRDAASAFLDAAELVGTFAPITRVGRAANIAAPVARRVMAEAPRIAEKAAPVVSKAAERAPEVTEQAAVGLGRGIGKLGRLAKRAAGGVVDGARQAAEEYRRERDS